MWQIDLPRFHAKFKEEHPGSGLDPSTASRENWRFDGYLEYINVAKIGYIMIWEDNGFDLAGLDMEMRNSNNNPLKVLDLIDSFVDTLRMFHVFEVFFPCMESWERRQFTASRLIG
ncbi:hypothetical protein TNCV_126531 [Trichonephila clavipes]|nr:hypothetical protein TNCV_126531 [Trichonephila clavipes]